MVQVVCIRSLKDWKFHQPRLTTLDAKRVTHLDTGTFANIRDIKTRNNLCRHVHKYSPMAIPCDFNPQDPNEIYLGDNIDLANCLKSEITQALKEHDDLKSIYQERMVTGNHSRTLPIGEFYIANGDSSRAFCTHGDREANEEYWKAYRAKPKGAGFLKRTFWVPVLEIFEDIYDRSVRAEILDRMAAIAKQHECTTYICGHYHPKEIIDITHNEIRIIILPRGRTELEL